MSSTVARDGRNCGSSYDGLWESRDCVWRRMINLGLHNCFNIIIMLSNCMVSFVYLLFSLFFKIVYSLNMSYNKGVTRSNSNAKFTSNRVVSNRTFIQQWIQ